MTVGPQLYNYVWWFNIDGTGVLMDGIHSLAPQITVRCTAIRPRATPHHFLIWLRTVRQTAIGWLSRCFSVTYTLIGERDNESTTPWLMSIDTCEMGDKTISDPAESSRESLYPHSSQVSIYHFNTLRPRQNGRHFPDIFKCMLLNENVWISLKISLTFFPKVRINNLPALVRTMVSHRSGAKPLSEAMMISLLTQICVSRSQLVKV